MIGVNQFVLVAEPGRNKFAYNRNPSTMISILVIGSLDLNQQNSKIFLKLLGEEIIDHGHHLLGGCRNEFDRIVAEAAFKKLKEKDKDPNDYITSYIDQGSVSVHEFGTRFKSQCNNWQSLASPGLDIPETVAQTDVVIVIGGREGTKCAANWARIANKPLMPLTNFGGSAAEIYQEEIEQFDRKYAERINRQEYELLNQVSSDLEKIAQDVVSLAARTIISNKAFVVMSFAENPALEDVFESFKSVCGEYNYECIKINDASMTDRIIPEIFSGIRKSAFVIADLSEPKPNVYYELGFADGLHKPVIITARKGTPLPFDVADVPTIFWEGQKQLKDKLREKIAKIANRQGR